MPVPIAVFTRPSVPKIAFCTSRGREIAVDRKHQRALPGESMQLDAKKRLGSNLRPSSVWLPPSCCGTGPVVPTTLHVCGRA
ncbi:MAG TPA: hypothetical protein VN706_11005 [Gemmatimonadaceae bacterium]|nr:hypothetical protein [Gemmatimonadaceae bacterium]